MRPSQQARTPMLLALSLLVLLLPAVADSAVAGRDQGTYAITPTASRPDTCPHNTGINDPPSTDTPLDDAIDETRPVLQIGEDAAGNALAATASIHIRFLGDASKLVLDVYDATGFRPYVFMCVYDNGELKETAEGYGTASSFRTWDEMYAWVLPHDPLPTQVHVAPGTVGTWEALY